MKAIYPYFLLGLLMTSATYAGSFENQKPPKISIVKASQIAESKLADEGLGKRYFIHSIKYIDEGSKKPHWRASYDVEYTSPQDGVIIPVYRFLEIYMDGSSKVSTSKGPTRRMRSRKDVKP
jgi:hypothetical protein